MPQGRVAYWAGWQLLGLNKDQWGAIHINIGFLFLITLALHSYYNWQSIVRYLQRATKVMFISKEAVLGALVTIGFICGTLFNIPPFSTILAVNDSFKNAASAKYGEPPYGHAELSSLANFCRQTGNDPQKAYQAIKAAGYTIDSEKQTLKEIALSNNITPQELYVIFRPEPSAVQEKLPPTAPPGTGNRTLGDLCRQYHLDCALLVVGLQAKGIHEISQNHRIKEIASANGLDPHALYEKIVEQAATSK
jgi:hypothetical protein